MSNGAKCIFTICARNYLAQALVLGDTLKEHEPDLTYFIYLVDGISGIEVDQLEHVCRSADTLGAINYAEMALRYGVIEFSTAIKPFVFAQLWAENFEAVIYLDPDIAIFQSLEDIFADLAQKSIVVTPHFHGLELKYTGMVPLTEILFVGGYNFGFVGIRCSDWGRRIVAWWSERLLDLGYADRWDSLHVDQRWMDLLPCGVPLEEIGVQKSLGYNVAFWNVHERQLERRDGNLFVGSREGILPKARVDPLVFFHFSGFDFNNPNVFQWRHPEFSVARYPEFQALFSQYHAALAGNSYPKYSQLPYAFGKFPDGSPITTLHRRIYRSVRGLQDPSGKVVTESNFFSLVQNSKLLLPAGVHAPKRNEISGRGPQTALQIVESILWGFHRIFGTKYYFYLLKVMEFYARPEHHAFLVKGFRQVNASRRK